MYTFIVTVTQVLSGILKNTFKFEHNLATEDDRDVSQGLTFFLQSGGINHGITKLIMAFFLMHGSHLCTIHFSVSVFLHFHSDFLLGFPLLLNFCGFFFFLNTS